MRRFVSLFAASVCWLLSSGASAALLVSFSPSSPDPLVSGSPGSIDVLLTSDNSADQLGSFFAQFLIAPVGAPPANPLIFSGVQSESQLGDANYVFAGNSGLLSLPAPVTSIAGGDTYLSDIEYTTGVPLAGPFGNRLLFRLDLAAFDPGQYTIELVTADFRPDALGEKSPLDFSSAPRTLTVRPRSGAPGVPEPMSAVLWIGLGVSGVLLLQTSYRAPRASARGW